jgi:DNA replication protein DnaC
MGVWHGDPPLRILPNTVCENGSTPVGAEFLFQVIAERAEKTAVIVTTNLPFSEWTQVIPNARLCKALIDRITDRASIIETGTDSYRFRRTLEKRKGRNAELNNISG